MTEQHAMSAREALDYLVERLQTQYATHQFDSVLPHAIPILTAALDEREKLQTACENAEQTLRNLSLGFLTGDLAQIALNEANNLHIALKGEV